MNLNLEKIPTEKGTIYLKLSIAEKELNSEVDKRLKKLQSSAMIKGFRKGQAPLNIIKSMHGKEVSRELFSKQFQESLDKELQGNDAYIGTPLLYQYPPESLLEAYKEDMKNGIISATVEIGYAPDFELKGFDKSTVIDYYRIDDIQERAVNTLEMDVKRYAQPVTLPEGTPVNEKDIVVLRLQELDENQQPLEGGIDIENSFAIEYAAESVINTLLAQKLGDSFTVNPRELDVTSVNNDSFFRKYIMKLEDNDDRTIGEQFLATIKELKRVAEVSEETIKATFGEQSSRERILHILEENLNYSATAAQNDLAFNKLFEVLTAQNPLQISDQYLLNLANSEQNSESKSEEKDTPEDNDRRAKQFVAQQIFRKMANGVNAEPQNTDYIAHAKNMFSKQSPYMMINITDELIEQIALKDDKFKKQHHQELYFKKSMAIFLEKVTLNEIPVSMEEFSGIVKGASEQYEVE